MKTLIEMARDAAAKHGHTFKAVPEPEILEFIEAFAVLVKAAHVEELLEGVEMPEPALAGCNYKWSKKGTDLVPVHVFTADQLRNYAAAAVLREQAKNKLDNDLLDEIGALLADVEYMGSYAEGIKALKAENERLRADAARWNFVTEHCDLAVCKWDESGCLVPIQNYTSLDAAMKGQP